KEEAPIQSIAARIARGKLLVRFGNANNLEIGTALTLPKESQDVPVDQAHDANVKRSSRLILNRINLSACSRVREEARGSNDQQGKVAHGLSPKAGDERVSSSKESAVISWWS